MAVHLVRCFLSLSLFGIHPVQGQSPLGAARRDGCIEAGVTSFVSPINGSAVLCRLRSVGVERRRRRLEVGIDVVGFGLGCCPGHPWSGRPRMECPEAALNTRGHACCVLGATSISETRDPHVTALPESSDNVAKGSTGPSRATTSCGLGLVSVMRSRPPRATNSTV